MTADLPATTHVYRNHHLDSTRWQVFRPRDDDIIITTAYKSGTTWTQRIFYHLIYGPLQQKPEHGDVEFWPDADFFGVSREDLAAGLENITARRYLKSHLPLDGLPYFENVRYVIVCRDPRDVFMSLFNHYSRYTDVFYGMLTGPMPRCPDDPRQFWRDWISRGWFPWESEGYPFWSNLHHTASYWRYRHLPNFLFIHYNDMLANLPDAIRRLAGFAGIATTDADIARVSAATTFGAMKKEAAGADARDATRALRFAGGESAFIYRGTNGRWRGVLTEEDLALYAAARQRLLPPDCAAWLEYGGPLPEKRPIPDWSAGN